MTVSMAWVIVWNSLNLKKSLFWSSMPAWLKCQFLPKITVRVDRIQMLLQPNSNQNFLLFAKIVIHRFCVFLVFQFFFFINRLQISFIYKIVKKIDKYKCWKNWKLCRDTTALKAKFWHDRGAIEIAVHPQC